MKYIIEILSYFVSAISSLLIFILVIFVCGFVFAFICPEELFNIELYLISVSMNIPSLIAIIIATLVATHTFRASRRAGILRWHKKTKVQKDKGGKDLTPGNNSQTNQALKKLI